MMYTMYHLTSATCCKDHIPNKKQGLINTEMICHHESSCTISHLSRAVGPEKQKEKQKLRMGAGEGGRVVVGGGHMVLTVDKFSDLLI